MLTVRRLPKLPGVVDTLAFYALCSHRSYLSSGRVRMEVPKGCLAVLALVL